MGGGSPTMQRRRDNRNLQDDDGQLNKIEKILVDESDYNEGEDRGSRRERDRREKDRDDDGWSDGVQRKDRDRVSYRISRENRGSDRGRRREKHTEHGRRSDDEDRDKRNRKHHERSTSQNENSKNGGEQRRYDDDRSERGRDKDKERISSKTRDRDERRNRKRDDYERNERDRSRERSGERGSRGGGTDLRGDGIVDDVGGEKIERRVGRTARAVEVDELGRTLDPLREEREKEKSLMDKETAKLLKAQRRLEKQQREKEKSVMKLTESAEEKRARRIAKREAKEKKRREKLGWDDEYEGYTNNDNPFGDSRLLEQFTWGKKVEKDSKLQGLTAEEIAEADQRRLEENKRELAKVKERRLQREKDIEEREKLREMEAREAMSNELESYAEKEEQFYVEQAKMRSMIRIENGRPKPIDLLVKYITVDVDSDEATIAEPYLVFQGLSLDDLDDLDADIEVYLGIGNDVDFWRDMLVLCKFEIDIITQRKKGSYINDTVRAEIMKVLSGKSLKELKQLEQQIATKLLQGGVVDVAYWESLREHLDVFKAKARLAEMHATVLGRKLERLSNVVMGADGPIPPAVKGAVVPAQEDDTDLFGNDDDQVGLDEEGIVYGEEVEGVYSLPVTDDERDAVDPDQEEKEMDKARHKQMAIRLGIRLHAVGAEQHDTGDNAGDTGSAIVSGEVEPDSNARTGVENGDEFSKMNKKVDDGDLIFNAEMPIANETYDWSDKYRPRKPRFFSRVHTGFEWNKYNQTHYDSRENPPPKIVQGYKFNVFYPDLLDRSKAPTYKLIPIPDEPDFCTIRFSAGPPYEDIAFKVVKREWEYSHKRGFKCQFDRGIFQLWFHFRRNRYRK
eukprot:CFRG0239T1